VENPNNCSLNTHRFSNRLIKFERK
jgi:hypothetical protein